MKKLITATAIICTAFACKKSTETKTEAPVKYYFRIEAIDNDGSQNTITSYKAITVH